MNLTEGASRAGAESRLAFDVTRDGKPVAVEQYLGAKGHLVALRQGDLAFLHVHPDESSLRFMAAFPTAGRYRLFLQFKSRGAHPHRGLHPGGLPMSATTSTSSSRSRA